jgi:hypothetical protein
LIHHFFGTDELSPGLSTLSELGTYIEAFPIKLGVSRLTPAMVKGEAAELWCRKMSGHTYGEWRHVLVQQRDFEQALKTGITTFGELGKRLRALAASRAPAR